jgi:hypothetical protein
MAVPSEPDGGATRALRRRRRVSRIRRWLPTILFCGVIAGLVVLGVGRLFISESPATVTVAAPAPSVAPEPAVVLPAAPEPPRAQPTSRGVRFSTSPIEPTYVVAGGDTLSAIAQRHNTTIDAIVAINNLPDRSTLHVGQRLIIP